MQCTAIPSLNEFKSCGKVTVNYDIAARHLNPPFKSAMSFVNPMLELEEWVRLADEEPILVSVAEPVEEKAGLFKSRMVYAVRTSNRIGLKVAKRSYGDFAAFRAILLNRFPGALIPALPPSHSIGTKSETFVQKRMHMLEFFIQAAALNPFFREDSSYQDFVSADVHKYDRNIADPKKDRSEQSEGVRRWMQALSKHPINESEKLRQVLLKEFDILRRQLKSFKSKVDNLIQKYEALSQASDGVYQGFADLYTLERDQMQILSGNTQMSSNTKTSMHSVLLDAADKSSQFAAVLKSNDFYSPAGLQNVLKDPIRFEIGMVDMWRENLDGIQHVLKAHRHAKDSLSGFEKEMASLETKGSDDKKAQKALEQLRNKKLPEAHKLVADTLEDASRRESGLLGIELGRFRADRVVRMNKIMTNLARFHLRSLDELSKAWDGTGAEVRLGRDTKGNLIVSKNADKSSTDHVEQKSKKKFSLVRHQSKKKGMEDINAIYSAANVSQAIHHVGAAGIKNGVQLRVTTDYSAVKSDELDISVGEVLDAKRIDDEMWYATSSNGDQGIVHARCVEVSTKHAAIAATPPGMERIEPPGFDGTVKKHRKSERKSCSKKEKHSHDERRSSALLKKPVKPPVPADSMLSAIKGFKKDNLKTSESSNPASPSKESAKASPKASSYSNPMDELRLKLANIVKTS